LPELRDTTPPNDSIIFSNVTVVRNQEGELSVWVGNEKILGAGNIGISNGILVLAIPLTRVRVAEDKPATQVEVNKDNVLEFKNFRALQLVSDNTTDETPTTDGDSQ
jgi:hypothetical protein